MVKNLLLARIDDRLIHGQVMTAWMKVKPAKRIIVVDDKVAADEFMIDVISLAAPTGVKVDVMTCGDACSALKELNCPTICLAKGPQAYKKLLEGGVDISELNVGGMGINSDRRTLYKNIAASDEERAIFREFLDKGMEVKIQIIPSNNAIDMKDALK